MNVVCPECGNPGGYFFCVMCGYRMFAVPCPFAAMCQTCTCSGPNEMDDGRDDVGIQDLDV